MNKTVDAMATAGSMRMRDVQRGDKYRRNSRRVKLRPVVHIVVHIFTARTPHANNCTGGLVMGVGNHASDVFRVRARTLRGSFYAYKGIGAKV